MSDLYTRFKAGLTITGVVLFFASCTNFEKVYQRNFDFPPPDSTKFSHLDENSGKQFDLLTGKSTGIDFTNAMDFKFLDDNNLYVNYYNGGGVAVLNLNGDSLRSLFTGTAPTRFI
jgi:hypothetical protein